MNTNFKILDLQEAQIEYLSDNVANSIGGGIGIPEREEIIREFASCITSLIEELRRGDIGILDYVEQRADCLEDYLQGLAV